MEEEEEEEEKQMRGRYGAREEIEREWKADDKVKSRKKKRGRNRRAEKIFWAMVGDDVLHFLVRRARQSVKKTTVEVEKKNRKGGRGGAGGGRE
eukprot:165033-Hanusia_phi.AAC.4